MATETMEKPVKRHVGQNLQRVRVYLGVKQDALASEAGISQQAISKIEQQEEIEEGLLKQLADALGVSPELIKNFDLERAVYNINHNNYRDATISDGATTFAIAQQINPVEKIVELYERLLKSEREKIEILMNAKQS
ncbi:MAG: helix-turn-helix transcriptional regulator [Lacibacter sp.]|jgi:transcriptional regulator with XRE-family HTH domain|nr:helix-turn-helix transcriptional regulator [Ferruginibacter sp.]HMP20293.1 helix-turn-helix transcriptional regulator [Ferruginibacter sp.]